MAIEYIPVPPSILMKAYKFDRALRDIKESWSSSDYKNNHSHGISKIGEYAFAKLAGLENSINWNVQNEGDGKCDFHVNGLKIDVKTTTYWMFPELKCYPKESGSDCYVLAAYKPRPIREVALIGFIERDILFCSKNYRPYKNLGYRYWASMHQLRNDWGFFIDPSIAEWRTRNWH